ncbi:MAG: hypothetical protein QW424_02810 [Candidatus Bathyarchaeia archaeon]
MDDSGKMNTIDFIINVLKEHEKKMDALVSRLERISSVLPTIVGEGKAERAETKVIRAHVNIICDNWNDFKSLCSGAEIVAFNQDANTLSIKALHENIVYEYRETLPAYAGSLKCGIPLKLQVNIDASETKRILSKELNIPENRIIKGEIQQLK